MERKLLGWGRLRGGKRGRGQGSKGRKEEGDESKGLRKGRLGEERGRISWRKIAGSKEKKVKECWIRDGRKQTEGGERIEGKTEEERD